MFSTIGDYCCLVIIGLGQQSSLEVSKKKQVLSFHSFVDGSKITVIIETFLFFVLCFPVILPLVTNKNYYCILKRNSMGFLVHYWLLLMKLMAILRSHCNPSSTSNCNALLRGDVHQPLSAKLLFIAKIFALLCLLFSATEMSCVWCQMSL